MTYQWPIDHLGAKLVKEEELDADYGYEYCCEEDYTNAVEINGFVDGWEWDKLWGMPYFVDLVKQRREHDC